MKAPRGSKKTLQKRIATAVAETDLFDHESPVARAQVAALSVFDLSAGDERALARPPSFTGDLCVLEWCADLIAHSPAAAGLLRAAAEGGWSAGLADLHHGGFHLDIPGKKLLLDNYSMSPAALGASIYFRNAFLITFIRALRDIAHEIRCGAPEENYPPEYALLLERARAADCDAVTVLAAWELRGAGFTDVWRHLLGSDEGDMAMIFTRYLERDPGALFDGSALAYAFRQWYADDDRVAGCDHETLESLDDMLLARPDILNPFGGKDLNARDIEDMSVLPDGICYLAGLGGMIMRDPFFCGMNDSVNQTHLFHLMYDLEVTMVNNVPFRDGKLARRIFPGAEIVRNWR